MPIPYLGLLVCAQLAAGAAEVSPAASDAPKAADAPAQRRIFVLDLAASGIDPSIARALSSVLSQAIRDAAPDASVYSQADIAQTLAVETQRQLLGCVDDVACLAEVGGALGADILTIGQLTKVGAVYLLVLRLVRPRDATTLGQHTEQIEGDEARLIEAVRQHGMNLIDPKRPLGQGFLDVFGSGKVSLDGKEIGEAPLRRVAVGPGNHTISWAGGQSRTLAVLPYQVTVVSPDAPANTVTSNDLDRLKEIADVLEEKREAENAPRSARNSWYGWAGAAVGRLGTAIRVRETFGAGAAGEVGYGFSNGWQLGVRGGHFQTTAGVNGTYASRQTVGVSLAHLSESLVTLSPGLSLAALHAEARALHNGREDRELYTLRNLESWSAGLGFSLALRVGLGPYFDLGLSAEGFVSPPVGEYEGSAAGQSLSSGLLFLEAHDAQPHEGSLSDSPTWWWVVWSLTGTFVLGGIVLYELAAASADKNDYVGSNGINTTYGNFHFE